MTQIAKRMNVHRTTVQRCITSMVSRKLIIRNARSTQFGQTTNSYDLGGLIRKATLYAREMLEEKKKNKQSRQLKVVGNAES